MSIDDCERVCDHRCIEFFLSTCDLIRGIPFCRLVSSRGIGDHAPSCGRGPRPRELVRVTCGLSGGISFSVGSSLLRIWAHRVGDRCRGELPVVAWVPTCCPPVSSSSSIRSDQSKYVCDHRGPGGCRSELPLDCDGLCGDGVLSSFMADALTN